LESKNFIPFVFWKSSTSTKQSLERTLSQDSQGWNTHANAKLLGIHSAEVREIVVSGDWQARWRTGSAALQLRNGRAKAGTVEHIRIEDVQHLQFQTQNKSTREKRDPDDFLD